MTDVTIASYIAGLIDGEGTISIRRFENGTGQLHYRPMIEISNTSKRMIDFVCKNMGNSSCFYKIYNSPYKLRNLGVYEWRVTGTHCIPVLETVMPYLIVKREQAYIVFDFCKRIGHRGEKWSNDKRTVENAYRRKLYLKMKTLNSGFIK